MAQRWLYLNPNPNSAIAHVVNEILFACDGRRRQDFCREGHHLRWVKKEALIYLCAIIISSC